MGKPDDVSQWAKLAEALLDSLHTTANSSHNPEESVAPHERAEDIADIARSLDAAHARGQAEQLEADAKIAETLVPDGPKQAQHVTHVAGHRIAQAIRKGEGHE